MIERISRVALLLLIGTVAQNDAFVVPNGRRGSVTTTAKTSWPFVTPRRVVRLHAVESDTAPASTASSPTASKPAATLGLITFDLDDTLYPIAPVIEEANAAFARTMAKFGYEGIESTQIDITAKEIRAAMPEEEAAALTHTQIRELAIRKELEKAMLKRKLQETADEWATQVSYLADVVVQYAKKWASTAVSDSVVNAIVNAWEMERHHAAERHLYTEILEVLADLKQKYPGVVIGAVTDGKANPMFMTFTLAQYFDFCMSWEDDQGSRSKFFKELSNVEGNADLKWIYNAANEKYKKLKQASVAISEANPENNNDSGSSDDQAPTDIWIHVGDDLAYDVGGSASVGARTILLELADKYEQTARHRFDNLEDVLKLPTWSTSTTIELIRRKSMNQQAEQQVDEKIGFLSQLPDAIDRIVTKVAEEEADVGP
mmetsp:Transcript_50600/g.75620  ORF Transcript_50600/g.75620 Transcript_50600/m.75620 type:complete len:432 (-) Transcript_50600:878-2173(-)